MLGGSILIFITTTPAPGSPGVTHVDVPVSPTPTQAPQPEVSRTPTSTASSTKPGVMPVMKPTPSKSPVPGTPIIVKPVPEAPQTTSIIIKDYAYSPATLTIKKGTTITWTNQDIAKHTVTGDSGGPLSEFFGKGHSYSYTFTKAGSYPYHCEPHPYMTATVVVTE